MNCTTLHKFVKCSGLIFVSILFMLMPGCDLAKPQGKIQQDKNLVDAAPAAPVITENDAPPSPVKDVASGTVADTSIKLDQTFEDKEYGFQFNYPAACTLEKSEGILRAGNLTLWFPNQKQKWDKNAIAITVKWMVNEQWLSKTKEQVRQEVKKQNGSLQLFEKIKLDGQDCTHIKVGFGGMLDPMGKRVSEQYFLMVKQSDLIINFSAPSDKFETFRPQFNAIVQSFKIEK